MIIQMTAISTEPKRQIDITIVRRWALGIGPGGHHFIILNVSINNTHVFVSVVVVYRTPRITAQRKYVWNKATKLLQSLENPLLRVNLLVKDRQISILLPVGIQVYVDWFHY